MIKAFLPKDAWDGAGTNLVFPRRIEAQRPPIMEALSLQHLERPYQGTYFGAGAPVHLRRELTPREAQEVCDLSNQAYIDPALPWTAATTKLAENGGFFFRMNPEQLQRNMAIPGAVLLTVRFRGDPQNQIAGFVLMYLDSSKAPDAKMVPKYISDGGYKAGRILTCIAPWAKVMAKALAVPSTYSALFRLAFEQADTAGVHFLLGKVLRVPSASRAIDLHEKKLCWTPLDEYQLEYLGSPAQKVAVFQWGLFALNQGASKHLLASLGMNSTDRLSLTPDTCRRNGGALDPFYVFDNQANDGVGQFMRYEGALVKDGELYVAHAFKRGYFRDPLSGARIPRFRAFGGRYLFDRETARQLAIEHSLGSSVGGVIPHFMCGPVDLGPNDLRRMRERLVPE